MSPVITHVTMYPRLRSNSIWIWYETNCPVHPHPEVVPNLARLSNLRWLKVGGGRLLPYHGFDRLLPHLPSLQRIQMTGGRPEDVRALQRMPNLVDLDIVFTCDCTQGEYRLDEDVGFPKLRSLRIAGSNYRALRSELIAFKKIIDMPYELYMGTHQPGTSWAVITAPHHPFKPSVAVRQIIFCWSWPV